MPCRYGSEGWRFGSFATRDRSSIRCQAAGQGVDEPKDDPGSRPVQRPGREEKFEERPLRGAKSLSESGPGYCGFGTKDPNTLFAAMMPIGRPSTDSNSCAGAVSPKLPGRMTVMTLMGINPPDTSSDFHRWMLVTLG
jgi:hypothetical protein